MIKTIKKLSLIVILTPLFVACSSGPSESEVTELVEEQYEQAEGMMNDAVGAAGDDEMAAAMGNMLAGFMPKLESVENVNCDSAGDNQYLCTMDITHTIGNNTATVSPTLSVSEVNGEWVLAN